MQQKVVGFKLKKAEWNIFWFLITIFQNMFGSMLAMKHECIWTNKEDIFYNQIVLMDAFIMNKLQVGAISYHIMAVIIWNIRIDLGTFLVEKEKGEIILNEDYNNKQKERVRRDFKDKIHHHGMKKEDARESLRFGQIFTWVTRVTFICVILNMTMYGL